MNLPPDGLRLLRVSIRSKIEVVLTYISLDFGGWDGAVVIILILKKHLMIPGCIRVSDILIVLYLNPTVTIIVYYIRKETVNIYLTVLVLRRYQEKFNKI